MPLIKFPENGWYVGNIAEGFKSIIPFLKKDADKTIDSVNADLQIDEPLKTNEIVIPGSVIN